MLTMKASLIHKPSNVRSQDCVIEKIVELTGPEYDALTANPLADRPYITMNKAVMYEKENVAHCLLLLGKGKPDGVLVEAEGYDYARRAAHIPNARASVDREIMLAAEMIVKDAIRNAPEGSWCTAFDEIEELTGLPVTLSNGIGSMLLHTLETRPEVAEVEYAEDCFSVQYHPDYCPKPNLAPEQGQAEHGLTLRDLLILGVPEQSHMVHDTIDVGFISTQWLTQLNEKGQKDYAAILDAQVKSIRDGAYGHEIVLRGVDPQTLMDFDRAAAHNALNTKENLTVDRLLCEIYQWYGFTSSWNDGKFVIDTREKYLEYDSPTDALYDMLGTMENSNLDEPNDMPWTEAKLEFVRNLPHSDIAANIAEEPGPAAHPMDQGPKLSL